MVWSTIKFDAVVGVKKSVEEKLGFQIALEAKLIEPTEKDKEYYVNSQLIHLPKCAVRLFSIILSVRKSQTRLK